MHVVAAENDLPIEHGHMYLSVPDYHLVLEPDRMRLVHGPLEIVTDLQSMRYFVLQPGLSAHA